MKTVASRHSLEFPQPVPSDGPSALATQGAIPSNDAVETVPVDYRLLDTLDGAEATRGISEDHGSFGIRPGLVLEGKYRVVRELGRGSMGAVFMAWDLGLNRQVAVKFLVTEGQCSQEHAGQFRREAVAMAAINDNNVAKVFTYGEFMEIPYFVMEYVDGRTLRELIAELNRSADQLPLREGLDILWQILGGLAEIHRTGTIHRDIKPANVMLAGHPSRALIVDFGLVRNLEVRDDKIPLAGTPAYMAPELVENLPGADCSKALDVYSAGVTAYELFTGRAPFDAENLADLLYMHVDEKPVPPSVYRKDMPPQLEEIILRAMAKDPAERFSDCDEFLRALMLLGDLDGGLEPSHPNSDSPPHRRAKRPRGARTTISELPTASKEATSVGRLLVVDADAEFRGIIMGVAKATIPDCQVALVHADERAWEQILEFSPSVIFVDFCGEHAIGPELVARLKAATRFEGVEIIAVDCVNAPADEQVLDWLGISICLRKPVDIAAMARLLTERLVR